MSPIVKEQVSSMLKSEIPFLEPYICQHIRFYEAELLYVLLPDVVNIATDLRDEGRHLEIDLIFALVERLFTEGDEYVRELVRISLIEDFRHIFGDVNTLRLI